MAGVPFKLSADDIEKVFSMNRLGTVLLDRIKETLSSRIVIISAMGYEFGSAVDIDTINDYTSVADTDTNPASNMTRYGRSKLCDVLFAKALAYRLEKERVCTNVAILA
ncbi:hypothetical protein BGZ82_005082 [Podila clonocystis]|nr:hypothetical protein BGZ82_005082 [Podila clonocystis]